MGIEVLESPTKAKANSVEFWQTQIREALRYRRLFGRSHEWAIYKNAYRNYFDKNVVPVNIIYAIGRSIIPQVYFRNPKAHIVPNKPGFTMHARVLERVDNYLIRHLGIKNTLKSEVLDSYLCGRGFGLLGYDSEFGYSSEFAAEELEAEGSLTQFNSSGKKIEYQLNVNPGMPWYLRCNPTDFVVPYGSASDARSLPWFAFRKMRPVRDVKEDKKYSNTSDLKGLYFSRLEGSDEMGSPPTREETSSEYVELWQLHDQRTGQVFVLTLDHNKFLRKDPDELQIADLPFRTIGFNEDPDYFWWTPDARLIIQQQYEINDIRTMSKAHRRVALLKVLYAKGMVGKEALDNLLSGDVKAAVEVDPGAGGDIRRSVALLQSHTLPDLTISAREVREDIREIIGFSRNQAGSFEESSGRRTATEAEIVRAASQIRADERRDIMSDHLTSVIKGLNEIISKNWTSERIIDIVGQDGYRWWVRFTGREIKGDFTYIINPEEAQPSTSGVQQAEALQFMEMAMKTGGGIDMNYILETWAGTFDWIDPQRLYPGQGAGRSPDRAIPFNQLLACQQSPNSRLPALQGQLQ